MSLNTPQMRGAIFQKAAPPAPYVFQPYPSHRYHPDGRNVIVANEEEDEALGSAWLRSPTEKRELTMAQLKAALDATRKERDELSIFSGEKVTEILELRGDLAAAVETIEELRKRLEEAQAQIAATIPPVTVSVPAETLSATAMGPEPAIAAELLPEQAAPSTDETPAISKSERKRLQAPRGK